MRCKSCGLEMVIYRRAQDGEAEYVCRNQRCSRFDKRLKKQEKEQVSEATPGAGEAN